MTHYCVWTCLYDSGLLASLARGNELMSCSRVKEDNTHANQVPLTAKVREYACAEPQDHKGRCACCDSQPYFIFVYEIGIRKAHVLHPCRLREAVEGNA